MLRRPSLTALLFVGLMFSCRKSEPPPPPVIAPPAPAAPVPAPAPVDAAVEAVEAVEEKPLTPCQRACSVTGNRKQMEGFLRCEKQGAAAPEDCRTKVLAATDTARAACRQACQTRRKD